MIKRVEIADLENGSVSRTEDIGMDAENVSVNAYGITATNTKSAIEEIVESLSNISSGSGFASGVIVDGVGALTTAMGNVKVGTNVNGTRLDNLLKAAYGTDNTYSVLHLSDTHGGTDCINGCAAAANEDDSIGFIIHTGDIVSSSYTRLLNVDCRCPRLAILGNHDAWDTYKSETAAAVAIAAVCGNNVVYGDEDTSYWYKDVTTDAGEHIRFIAVNEYDYSNADFNESSTTPWIYEPVQTQRQLDWFCDLLYSTPSEYYIVVFTHTPLQENVWSSAQDTEWVRDGKHGQSLSGNTWFSRIIDAYLNHQVFTGTFTVSYREYFTLNYTYDFSSLTSNATFICFMCGHTHYDCMGFLSSYSEKLMLCITKADSVASGTDDMDRTSVSWVADKVTFDLTLRKVVVKRIGTTALTGGGTRDFIQFDF